MATELILVDVGLLYKRLFNHRPVIQNEVHYFVKEFESKGENNDLRTLQDAMSKADEINSVFLNEVMCSNPHFRSVKEKTNAIRTTCEEILSQDNLDLWISPEEQTKLDQQYEAYRQELKQKEKEIFSINDKELVRLKEEIKEVRDTRSRMRSCASSISSSVTIFPPTEHSTTPSPDDEEVEQSTVEELEGRDIPSPDNEDQDRRKEEEQCSAENGVESGNERWNKENVAENQMTI